MKNQNILQKVLNLFNQGKISIYRNKASAFFEQGNQLNDRKDWQQAEYFYQQALFFLDTPLLKDHPELDVDRASCLINVGVSYYTQGQITKAITSYEKAMVLLTLSHLKDRLELDDDRVILLMNLGVSYNRQGQIKKAITSYEKALALHTLSHLKDRPELDKNRASLLMNLGVSYDSQGKITRAITSYEKALALHTLSHLKDRPELDKNRASLLMNMGISYDNQSQITKAITSYEKALTLHVLPHLKDRPELDNDRAHLLMNLGVSYNSQGLLTKSIASYEKALALHALPHLKDRSELDIDRTRLLINLGVSYDSQGKITRAITSYEKALTLHVLPHLKDRPELDNDRAHLLMNLGVSYNSQGLLTKSIASYEKALALHALPHLKDRLELDGFRSLLLMNLGLLYDSQGKLMKAIASYEVALELHTLPHLKDRPELDADRARILLNLGISHRRQGQYNKAIISYDEASYLYEGNTIGNWLPLNVDRAKLYAAASFLLPYRTNAVIWAKIKSVKLAELMELAPSSAINDVQWLGIFDNFAKFHENYLNYAIESQQLHLIPEILATIQGRETIADIVDQVDDASFPDAVRAYQQLRAKLRALQDPETAQKILDESNNNNDSRSAGLNTTNKVDFKQHVMAEYQRLYATLAIAREQAAKESGYELLLQPHRQLEIKTLQNSLQAKQALLLLVNIRDQHGALLVFQEQLQWIELEDLSTLGQHSHQISQQLAQRRGYRRGAGSEPSDEKWSSEKLQGFWQTLEDQLQQQLWQHLSSHLENITELACITHGKLHLLPLSAGKPEHIRLRHYPGLVFYAFQQGLYDFIRRPPKANKQLEILHFEGMGTNKIPAVNDEADSLTQLCQQQKRHVRLSCYPEGQQYSQFLHIACHGGEISSQNLNTNHQIILQIGEQQGQAQYLTMRDIMNSRSGAKYIYINSCLGGQTHDDPLSGNPSGLIIGFLRNHSQAIIACLISIPDRWAYLLSILVHQSFIRQADSLEEALIEGKRRLSTGDWYEDTENLLSRNFTQDIVNNINEDIVRYKFDKTEGYKKLHSKYYIQADSAERLFASKKHERITMLQQNPCWRVPPQPDLGILLHGMQLYGRG